MTAETRKEWAWFWGSLLWIVLVNAVVFSLVYLDNTSRIAQQEVAERRHQELVQSIRSVKENP